MPKDKPIICPFCKKVVFKGPEDFKKAYEEKDNSKINHIKMCARDVVDNHNGGM